MTLSHCSVFNTASFILEILSRKKCSRQQKRLNPSVVRRLLVHPSRSQYRPVSWRFSVHIALTSLHSQMTSSQRSIQLHIPEPGQDINSDSGETFGKWSWWLKQDRNPERMTAWLRRHTSVPRISAQLSFPISSSSLTNYLMRDERYRKLVERNSKLSEKGKQRFDRLGLIDQDDFERRVAGDQGSELPPASCTGLAVHYGVSRCTVKNRWGRCTPAFKRRHRLTFYPSSSTTNQAPSQPGLGSNYLQYHSHDTPGGTTVRKSHLHLAQTSRDLITTPTIGQGDFMSKPIGEQGISMNAQRMRDHYEPMSQIYGAGRQCPEGWRKEHSSISADRDLVILTKYGTQSKSLSGTAPNDMLNSMIAPVHLDP